jgi:cell division protein FtsL
MDGSAGPHGCLEQLLYTCFVSFASLINQKSRILNLENEVKQLRNTLSTYKEGNDDIERPTREHPPVCRRRHVC